MDKDKVSAALRDLAAEHAKSPRSQTARLREVIDDLEAALTAGASHAAVLATLQCPGVLLHPAELREHVGEVAEGAAGAGWSPGNRLAASPTRLTELPGDTDDTSPLG